MVLYYLEEIEKSGGKLEKGNLYKKGIWKNSYLGTLSVGQESCKVIVECYSNGCTTISTMPPFLGSRELTDENDEKFENVVDSLNAQMYDIGVRGFPTSTEILRWVCFLITAFYMAGSIFMFCGSAGRFLFNGGSFIPVLIAAGAILLGYFMHLFVKTHFI